MIIKRGDGEEFGVGMERKKGKKRERGEMNDIGGLKTDGIFYFQLLYTKERRISDFSEYQFLAFL